jgi:hypothetical protein
MAAKWERVARGEVMMGQINPDYVPRYRIPARRFWQLWKPKWQWVEGVSQNQIRSGHAYLPASAEPRPMRTLGDDFEALFGFRH